MGELHGDCPALNHAIEWVEKVPVSGNPFVDARDAQVGSLADRSRTYHAETTFPTALDIRISVSCPFSVDGILFDATWIQIVWRSDKGSHCEILETASNLPS